MFISISVLFITKFVCVCASMLIHVFQLLETKSMNLCVFVCQEALVNIKAHQGTISSVIALGSLYYKLGLGLSSNPTLTQQDRKERWNSLETSARQGFIGMGVSEGVSSLASMELNVCCEPTSGCSEAGA